MKKHITRNVFNSLGLLIFSSFIAPPELECTNFFYKNSPDIIRVRDGKDNEINVRLPDGQQSGYANFNREDLPSLYIFFSKNYSDFHNRMNKKPDEIINVYLTSTELMALTQMFLQKANFLSSKKKGLLVEEMTTIMSCLDKAIKTMSADADYDPFDRILVDKILKDYKEQSDASKKGLRTSTKIRVVTPGNRIKGYQSGPDS